MHLQTPAAHPTTRFAQCAHCSEYVLETEMAGTDLCFECQDMCLVPDTVGDDDLFYDRWEEYAAA